MNSESASVSTPPDLGPGDKVAVAVIGAGAAGIAAARTLAAAGVSHIVLEARSRLGGRAWTCHDEAGTPFDLGCGWLHSADRNPWCGIAEQLGLTLDRTLPPWREPGRNLSFPPGAEPGFRAASDAFYERLEAARAEPEDHAAAEYLEPGCRWNPLIDAGSTYYNGAELDRVSVRDFGNYIDTEINWRVTEGLGTAIAAHGAGLPVRFDCPVAEIDHSGRELRIVTPRGVLRADMVIVTISTNLLAGEHLRFRPALPAKIEAASYLPLGYANKVVLAVTEPEILPVSGRVHGHIDRTATGSYHLRPRGKPLVEGFFGGTFARELEGLGAAAFAEHAIDEIAGQLGNAVRKHLHPLAATGWAGDPYALGGYSHALPGHAECRAVLAAPVENRLFFAGEACSRDFFSTAHGAYLTGAEAAAQALASLRG